MAYKLFTKWNHTVNGAFWPPFIKYNITSVSQLGAPQPLSNLTPSSTPQERYVISPLAAAFTSTEASACILYCRAFSACKSSVRPERIPVSADTCCRSVSSAMGLEYPRQNRYSTPSSPHPAHNEPVGAYQPDGPSTLATDNLALHHSSQSTHSGPAHLLHMVERKVELSHQVTMILNDLHCTLVDPPFPFYKR